MAVQSEANNAGAESFWSRINKAPHVLRRQEAIARGECIDLNNTPYQQELRKQKERAIEREREWQEHITQRNIHNAPLATTVDQFIAKLDNDPEVVIARHNIASGKVHSLFLRSKFMRQASANNSVPCNSYDVTPMSQDLANAFLTKIPDWQLVNQAGKLKLTRSWKVESLAKRLGFIQAIAAASEALGHHPDIHLDGCNNVTIEIWTRSVDGVTENDFMLAAKIDKLEVAHL